MITYKEKIDKFYTENYSRLEDVANRECQNTVFNPFDLLSELYVYLIDNPCKISGITHNMAFEERNSKENPLLLYSTKWMINNIRLFKPNNKASNFQAKFSIKEKELTNTIITNYNGTTYQEYETTDINFLNEKEFHNLIIFEIINNLNESDRIIYNKLKEGKTEKEIMELYPNITKYGIRQIIADVKYRIKSEFNKKLKKYK